VDSTAHLKLIFIMANKVIDCNFTSDAATQGLAREIHYNLDATSDSMAARFADSIAGKIGRLTVNIFVCSTLTVVC
jgi:hypothetical protein